MLRICIVSSETRRKIDFKDLPEPPRKVARKPIRKGDPAEGRTIVVPKESSKQLPVDETIDAVKPEVSQSMDPGTVIAAEGTSKVVVEEAADVNTADHLQGRANEAEKQGTSELEEGSQVDVMDIVSTPRERSTPQRGGVRTRIIMHRETDASVTVGSGLVERVRQQMRATAGYVRGEDLSKIEVSDDRFVAAFKAALLSSREKSKEVKPTAARNGKTSWLAKVLNQKNQGKGSRDSLTRKLYAGGTGRWDRDWDIAFWKERSSTSRTAQKEAEDEIKAIRRAGQKHEEEDPIFKRIYVADTSLFPRSEDVQLLSAQAKNSARGDGTGAIKSPPVPLSVHKDGLQTAPLRLGAKLGSSPKLTSKNKSVEPQVSAPASAASKGDVKKDKRQWALEVLARKTGTSSNGSVRASGIANATGSADTGEGQFGFLLQLPLEMRPLLQHNRQSKVPTAVRQVQLNRLVEQELRSSNLAVIENSPECEVAVNRAKDREEEIFSKSNSKGVYVNLCVRSLKNGSTANLKQRTEEDQSQTIQQALEATGLVESPSASPSRGEHDCHASTSKEDEMQTKELVDKGKGPTEEKGVNTVLGADNLDAKEVVKLLQLNNFENTKPAENLSSAKLQNPPVILDSDGKIEKMTVILSTASSGAQERINAPSRLMETLQVNQSEYDGVVTADLLQTPGMLVQKESLVTENKGLFDVPEGSSTGIPVTTDTVLMAKNQFISSVSPGIKSPSNEGLRLNAQNQEAMTSVKTGEFSETNINNLSEVQISEPPAPPVVPNVEDWMNSGKFADLDRRIESIRQSTSPSTSREFEVPWSADLATVTNFSQNDLQNCYQSVKKQVICYPIIFVICGAGITLNIYSRVGSVP